MFACRSQLLPPFLFCVCVCFLAISLLFRSTSSITIQKKIQFIEVFLHLLATFAACCCFCCQYYCYAEMPMFAVVVVFAFLFSFLSSCKIFQMPNDRPKKQKYRQPFAIQTHLTQIARNLQQFNIFYFSVVVVVAIVVYFCVTIKILSLTFLRGHSQHSRHQQLATCVAINFTFLCCCPAEPKFLLSK